MNMEVEEKAAAYFERGEPEDQVIDLTKVQSSAYLETLILNCFSWTLQSKSLYQILPDNRMNKWKN